MNLGKGENLYFPCPPTPAPAPSGPAAPAVRCPIGPSIRGGGCQGRKIPDDTMILACSQIFISCAIKFKNQSRLPARAWTSARGLAKASLYLLSSCSLSCSGEGPESGHQTRSSITFPRPSSTIPNVVCTWNLHLRYPWSMCQTLAHLAEIDPSLVPPSQN